MGKFIQNGSKVIAGATIREAAILESLKHEQDAERLTALVAELGQVREAKVAAKSLPEDEFQCALHHQDGLPATFQSTARVVLEVSAAFVYGVDDEKGTMHNFRKRHSYLVICPKCAKRYKVVENLTDELETP